MKTFTLLFVLLFSTVVFSFEKTKSWYKIQNGNFDLEKKLAERSDIDFRGCYGEQHAQELCLFVHSEAIEDAHWIKAYNPQEHLWVHGGSALAKSPEILFQNAPEKPSQGVGASDWFSPVPETRVLPPATKQFRLSAVGAKKNPNVQAYVDAIKQDAIQAFDEKLASYNTRNSLSSDAVAASKWIADQAKPYCTDVVTEPFRTGYSDNVLCYVKGKTDEVIYVGAHYDSRSTNLYSTTQRAPGADDNGTGSSAVFELLKATSGVPAFNASMIFAWFSGEEQGLYGSKALAAKANKSKTRAMINMDMIGYDPENKKTVYFDRDRVTSSLREEARALVKEYLPGISTGLAVGCCSDGQSFYNQGIPTVSVFEGAKLVYPYYHKSDDLPKYVNFEHVKDTAQAVAALVATLAYQ